ncbi:P-loop containing nucleoside triphosphate hydrolase protein [Cantharellus anzutake]|uniref:P-loop containing nucleoside triphosphate hydrolase protein n=1 Tax=Cantharellus anzutake TaxID=1750568 RepID=UPI0019059419|nr:P-loop containing nucleoside triphosphate hydrolase protein [Cantharellus anzutake]KAF8336514.1 P-loop containing nucleoside triphosphate hydrolase protein [Cantharellus anzutake]
MKKQPLSIEALLQKQKDEREANSRPKFLTKEDRAKLAIEQRVREVQEQREREERLRLEREEFEKRADDLRRQEEQQRYGAKAPHGTRYSDERQSGRKDSRRYDDRTQSNQSAPQRPAFQNGIPTGPRADRRKTTSGVSQESSVRPSPPPPPPSGSELPPPTEEPSPSDSNAPFVPPLSATDLSAIRSRYLGVDKKKRKIRKLSDKKFVFDWDEQEDTFADAPEPVSGSSKPVGSVMFGRGHLAGMDDGGVQESMSNNNRHADPLERRKANKGGGDERHWSEKSLEEMRDRDWRIFREDFSIATRGGHIPLPLRSWKESKLPLEILEIIDTVGYKEPSPIQRQAIPIGLQCRDLIGIAETGSGKTAAFVLPMLVYIQHLPHFTDENRHLGPYALILAPTRELAQQIETESRKFAAPLGFRCVSIVGGRAVEEQQFNLREGAEIIIATPGRLKDVIDRHVLVLSQCRYVVMDEADRMVHLGFEADLTFILDSLPADAIGPSENGMDVDATLGQQGKTRVTTLFSATMPPAVERLSRKYLRRPAVITIGEAGRAVDTVEQRVELISGDEKKKQRMIDILNNGGFSPPMIVFVNQKKTADMVARDISRAGWSTSTLHSGKNQEQREAALAALRGGEADVLVATDLAGRGIDVQDVSLVINYQMAGTIEAYVHRIGRTGRAGKTGVAITFLTNDDDEVMYDLKNEIAKSPISKVPPELARHEAAQQRVTREMKRKREGDDQG